MRGRERGLTKGTRSIPNKRGAKVLPANGIPLNGRRDTLAEVGTDADDA
jgi:hypothetical protein